MPPITRAANPVDIINYSSTLYFTSASIDRPDHLVSAPHHSHGQSGLESLEERELPTLAHSASAWTEMPLGSRIPCEEECCASYWPCCIRWLKRRRALHTWSASQSLTTHVMTTTLFRSRLSKTDRQLTLQALTTFTLISGGQRDGWARAGPGRGLRCGE